MSDASITPFFAPRGVAVIGASQDSTKLGYGLARNLVQSNFQGAVYFVNPRGGSLMGRPVYTSVLDTPDPVDLAILLIPAQSALQAIQACGERGIRAVVIGSGGFRETGAEGAAFEAACLHMAQEYQIRLLGPNCVGILDTHLPMNATFLSPPGPLPGEVAFISHSGAICAAVIDWARGQSFGLSRLVSLGNQADVSETDMLAPVAADPFTRVLTMYLEGVSDGRRFIEEARRITSQKPVIALKVGRFASGQRAVASHTGALAGQENAFNAAFRRAGVIRAETSEEMFDWARALAWCRPPEGRNIAVLTNAGGPGVTASDALEANGMRLAQLSQITRDRLHALLPPAASLHNPVDMLASASPENYANCLQALLTDPGVDGVMIILPPPPMFAAGAVAKAVIPVIHNGGKPVIVALMGDRLIQEAVEHFRAAHVPEYRFPERAASALAVLARRAEYLRRVDQATLTLYPVDRERARLTLREVEAYCRPGDFLPAQAVTQLLQAYGIPTPPLMLAHSAAEAEKHARQTGFPVALKIASSDITHKSDANGIMLNLGDANAVTQGYQELVNNVERIMPEARILGVHVQRMVPGGQDVIIGAVQDAQFGPLVMFGSGGVEVEGLKDVAFALAPVTGEEAEYLLNNTWAGKKLAGFRGTPPADRQAILEALQRLAQLAADFPQIAEIEVNPLRALAAGMGVFAIDARARLASEQKNA